VALTTGRISPLAAPGNAALDSKRDEKTWGNVMIYELRTYT